MNQRVREAVAEQRAASDLGTAQQAAAECSRILLGERRGHLRKQRLLLQQASRDSKRAWSISRELLQSRRARGVKIPPLKAKGGGWLRTAAEKAQAFGHHFDDGKCKLPLEAPGIYTDLAAPVRQQE